jgi:hypothetical protein
VGCGDKTGVSPTPTPSDGTTGTSTGTAGATGTTGTTGTAETTKPLERSAIPAELKHSAYEYFGLENDKPVDMQVVFSTDATVRTGTVSTTFTEMKDGQAVFDIERTGGLADIGTQKIALKKDGIYLVSSSASNIEAPQMELPADLSPGKSWKSTLKVDQPGRTMELNTTYTVKGVEKFTTKKGGRQGLLVVATGNGTMNSDKITFNSREWYVKGVGGVKAILTTKTSKGASQTITIEEAK